MEKTRQWLDTINRAIVQFRGIYSAWSASHGISYNEMLVLYTIRDQGYCTQKQICDSYLLPRQTINHVIAAMRQAGIAYATEQIIDLIANDIHAVHVYTMNKPEVAAQIKSSLSEILI